MRDSLRASLLDRAGSEGAAAKGDSLRGRGIRPRVLIVGGSCEPSSPVLIAALAATADAVVAVDRGLDVLLAAGLGCDLFCGDADSVGPRGASLVAACLEGRDCDEMGAGARCADTPTVAAVERYNPHKDYTDLELALHAVEERWPGATLICTCLAGGKPDHALAVLGCLMTWDGALELVEDGFEGRIMRSGDAWEIGLRSGARFSFIPLSMQALVSEAGMRWGLDRRRVPLLSDLGISNVIEADAARVICHEGTLAAYLFR